MIHEDEHGFKYYLNLKECVPEYTPVKVWSLLQFFTLAGRKSVLAKDNFIPIPDLKYVVLGNSCYYVREVHQSWTLDAIYFYKQTIDSSKDDIVIENIQRYVTDGRVWLLLTPDHIEDISGMLTRVYKANNAGEGKLNYRLYLQIAELALKREDFADLQKSITGYKTSLKIMDDRLAELFKQAYNDQRRTKTDSNQPTV